MEIKIILDDREKYVGADSIFFSVRCDINGKTLCNGWAPR